MKCTPRTLVAANSCSTLPPKSGIISRTMAVGVVVVVLSSSITEKSEGKMEHAVMVDCCLPPLLPQFVPI
eukprot:6537402-Ditylum_brightwellii.AAC.1